MTKDAQLIYETLIKHGVQEAEARDRAAMSDHPVVEIDQAEEASKTPAQEVLARSRKERKAEIAKAASDFAEVSKEILEKKVKLGLNPVAGSDNVKPKKQPKAPKN